METNTKNSKALVEMIINLLKRDEDSTVNLFINSHGEKEKQFILDLLIKKREDYIEKASFEDVQMLSKYLKKPLSEDEKEAFVKNKIKTGFSNSTDCLEQIFIFFPKGEKTYYLQFFIDAELLHTSIQVAKKLGLSFSESFLKKELKKALEKGYLPDLKTILDYISEKFGKERILTPREKKLFLSNFYFYSLEDFLDCETFLKTKLDPKLLLEKRKRSISDLDFNKAIILSRITGKILTREELTGILDGIFDNFYSFSQKDRKNEIERLENLLPKNIVKEIKEKKFFKFLEMPWLEAVKFLAKELEIKLSVDNYKTMIKNSILKENIFQQAEILEDMEKDYPGEVAKMKVL
jgi:hypothetical protein